MRKFVNNIRALAFLMIGCFTWAACGGDDEEKEQENKQDDTEFLLTPFIPYMEWGAPLEDIQKYMGKYSFWSGYQRVVDPSLGEFYVVHLFDCKAKYPSSYATVHYNFWNGVYNDVVIVSGFGTVAEVEKWVDFYRLTYKAVVEDKYVVNENTYDEFCKCTVNGKQCEMTVDVGPGIDGKYYGTVNIGLEVYDLGEDFGVDQ